MFYLLIAFAKICTIVGNLLSFQIFKGINKLKDTRLIY
jgi:hypothetical protein